MSTPALDRARALLDRPPPTVPPGQLAVNDGPRIGSLCTGYGGLDMAVMQVLGGSLAWVADPDPGATAILAHHHPDVPNLGDLTAVDWASVEPVDIVCGGYPCQPFSVAGLRKGTADERHIWPHIATALRVLRPRLCLFENVAGHLRLGFADVLADLARLGFDAEWCLVHASEVGAPHQRNRLFIVATAQDADGANRDQWRLAAPGQAESRGARADTRGRGGAPAADASGPRLEGGGTRRAVAQRPGAAADSQHAGLARSTAPGGTPGGQPLGEPAGRRPDAPSGADCDRRKELQRSKSGVGTQGDADRRGEERWGRFAPAVHRWEQVTGTAAPSPVNDRGRLAPVFVEWLMGVPAGHVTAVPGLSRTRQLKALGNGVVPRQGAAALRLLLDRAGVLR